MPKTPIGKFALLAGLGSAFAGFLHALPRLGAPPASNDLLAAARGLATLENIPGFLPASLADRVTGWLWQLGGPHLLGTGLWLGAFLAWTAATFLVLVGARFLAQSFPRVRALIFGLVILALFATCASPVLHAARDRRENVSNLNLIAPVELANAASSAQKGELFANVSALPHLLLFAPRLVGSLTPADAASLARNPTAWRDALRKNSWNTVLLAGPTQEYQPLLSHLLESPDWHLALVTNTGFLFRRGTGPAAPSLDPEKFQLATPTETAIYLSQIAEYYEAIRRTADARQCLDKSLELAPVNVTVLARAASFAAARKRWQDAVALADRALAIHPGFSHAKIVKALALVETHQPGLAQSLLDEALAQNPDDIYTLFLYARVCREQNDYVHEAEALEKVIALSDKIRQPSVHYRIYLAQAYGRQGRAKEAIANYQAALDSNLLKPNEAKEIQESLDNIKAAAPKDNPN